MKKSKLLLASLLCVFVLTTLSSDVWAAKRKKKKPYAVSARSALLIKVSNGKKYYAKNIAKKVLPASTTKVMTALLVMERLPLDKWVTVSKAATLAQPTKAGFMAGEQYKISDLLYAALMQSANDAAVVLAEAVAGSEDAFVRLMNKRARDLGARNTKFANANGLPTSESQYTTAYDMSLIFKAALKFPFFKDALQYKNRTIRSQNGRLIAIRSFNQLLMKNWKKKIGGKTGYTRQARYCFVGYFQDGRETYIVNVFGCSRRWQDIRYIITRYGGISL